MKKKNLLFICYFVFAAAFIAGCGNGNIFSWAHDSGSGDYVSLMSDGKAAMKSKDYKKAESYYHKAMSKKPDDKEAIYGYCSAVFADAVKPVFTDIVNTIINEGSGGGELFDDLDRNKLTNLENALEKIVGENNDLLAKVVNDGDITYEEGMVDKNLNAAVSYLLYGVLQIINSPDPDVQNTITFDNNFAIDSIPDYNDQSASPAVRNAISELVANVEKAYQCVERISSDYAVDTSLIEDVRKNNMNIIESLVNKGYTVNY